MAPEARLAKVAGGFGRGRFTTASVNEEVDEVRLNLLDALPATSRLGDNWLCLIGNTDGSRLRHTDETEAPAVRDRWRRPDTESGMRRREANWLVGVATVVGDGVDELAIYWLRLANRAPCLSLLFVADGAGRALVPRGWPEVVDKSLGGGGAKLVASSLEGDDCCCCCS